MAERTAVTGSGERNAWAPAPLGLRGKPLEWWVTCISRAEGRCACREGDCGKKHKDGQCSHVHGLYQDKAKQLMIVMNNGEVFCQACVKGMQREMAKAEQRLADEQREGLF